MDDKHFTVRIQKRWVRVSLIVAVTALIVAPLTAVATHSFNDVPNDHTFHSPIEWMKESEVTRGCNPPTNNLYCPQDFVTRGQMAAFFERFAQYIDAEDGTLALAKTAEVAEAVVPGAEGVALAGVVVTATGTVQSWFNLLGGEPTVETTVTGRYDITIPGASIPTNATQVIQHATPRTTAASMASVSGFEGAARVRLFSSAGTLTNTPFTYVLYGPLTQVTSASTSTPDTGPDSEAAADDS